MVYANDPWIPQNPYVEQRENHPVVLSVPENENGWMENDHVPIDQQMKTVDVGVVGYANDVAHGQNHDGH